MSQRTRMRRLAVWLALALALWLPLAAAAAESDDSDDDEQADVKKADEAPASKSDAEQADEEEEGETGSSSSDWAITHKGLYLIAQGSYSFMTADSDLEDKARDATEIVGGTNGHVDGSWGYGGRLGYRFLDWLAVEAQARVLNSIKIKLHDQDTGGDLRSKATFFTAMANAKGYLLTDRFQPYVLCGAGYGYAILNPPGDTSKDRSSGFAAQFGVGMDYYVTDNLGLMTEVSYMWPSGGVSDYDNVSITFGAMLRFYGEK